MKKPLTVAITAAVVIFIILAAGPFFVLDEGEQSVTVRFGKIVDSDRDAGLKLKMPFIDTVVKYPKKILAWDGDPQRVPTKENQFIYIDSTARWKIIDPVKFYSSVSSLEQASRRLDEIIDSTVRTVISENLLRESVRNSNIIKEIKRTESYVQSEDGIDEIKDLKILTDTTVFEDVQKGRFKLSEEMLANASKVIGPQFGIELIDIIIRQIRYSEDLTESVYNRMITERNRIAQFFRSHGEGKKAEWFGRLENDQKAIMSLAYAKSEEIKGKADAEATRIYSESYSADPEFFKFWRSVESYRTILPKMDKTLSTNIEYFRYLYSQFGN
jgi:membrane protease subunit HflC